MAYFWQSPLWQKLRSGQWLTVSRARGYSLILLGLYAIAVVGWIALSNGLVDRNGKPVGTDFSSFYAAGSLVLDGRAGGVYDMAAHYAREQQIFGTATPYYGWLYPPIFLLVATPLALMPYPLALAAWQGGTFAFYLAVIAAILRRPRQDGGAIADIWLLLEQGEVGFEKLQSVYAAVRMWGGGISLAYMVQGAASVVAVCSVAWIWRSSRDRDLKAALLTAAALLASPHVLDYDLMILAP